MGTWKRTVHGDTSMDRAPITYERGSWRIEKEFYADGITLFTYMVYGPEGFEHEVPTLTEAKQYVDRREGIA